ncbi:MAG: diguanylate cyclase [Sphaerochaeta sp.]|nr:diguanylate cyclase [Sphaerochaeta sp.]
MNPHRKILQTIGTLLFILIVLATLLDVSNMRLEPIWETNAYRLDDGWTLMIEGEQRQTDFQLPTVLKSDRLTGKTVVLSRTIPDDVHHLNSLMIRTSQKSVEVRVDGERVYLYHGNLDARRLKILGYLNHFVWLGDQAKGKYLEIITVANDPRTSETFYDVYIGSRVSQIVALLRYDGFSFLFGLLILLTAAMVSLLTFTLFRKLEIRKSALAFAGIEFCAGLWIISGSMSTQLIIHNQLVLLVFGLVAMFLLPYFLTSFVINMYHVPQSKLLGRIVLVFPFGFIVISSLQLMGILTYYDILTPAAIILLSYLVLLIFFSIRAYLRGNSAVKQFLIAISCLVASVVGELVLLLLPFMTLLNALVLNLGIVTFGTVLLRQVLVLVMKFVERKGKEEYLLSLAHSDGLTGLANRRAFDERMDEIRERKKLLHPIGLMVFDVNDLKMLNDKEGHAAGDALLREVARQLSRWFSGTGDVYRIGGDEFAMICDPCNTASYESIRKEIASDMLVRATDPTRFSLAFGEALFTPNGELTSIDDVFAEADARMYRHKMEMKNGFVR